MSISNEKHIKEIRRRMLPILATLNIKKTFKSVY